MRYIIYGRPQCKYCDAAKALLLKHGLPYQYIDAADSPAIRIAVKAISLAQGKDPTVPQIIMESVDGSHAYIGGFTELEKQLSELGRSQAS